MSGIIDWAADRVRMVLAFVALSLVAGVVAYVSLPKEGEPDIDIPGLFISVPFPGISASDSEKLLVKPMETRLSEIDGLDTITATAAEGYVGMFLEFEFGWDKTATIADVRDKMGQAEAEFPAGADQYSISEINFSEFPILIVALSGSAPERTLLRLAAQMQDRLEAMPAVLEAGLAGHRDEMLEVLIDPLALEAYDVTAAELADVVTRNNLLVATGEVETATGAFPVKIPGSFESPADVYALPVKADGDRVVTLGDLAQINLTFEDRTGTARYNGETTVALQVVKRKGFNIIDTAQAVRDEVAAETATWPDELREAVDVTFTLDQSRTVQSMVSQLEGSVLTAIALVMIVVLASLGMRSALLVGFAIPTSFLLAFALMAVMGITISNIVMFGLILAVGILVDGAIIVVEYADKRISEGSGPMRAYTEAAKRMFWPVVSSTATTLCAFLPMLFWPGVAGEFMGMLPVTIIFVLLASLVVALVYLPVLGGVAGRMSRSFERCSTWLRDRFPWIVRAALAAASAWLMVVAILQTLNPGALVAPDGPTAALQPVAWLVGPVLFVVASMCLATSLGSVSRPPRPAGVATGYRRSWFGRAMHLVVGNPVGPIVAIGLVGAAVFATYATFAANNNGVEFFVESELENANIYVRARGNLSLAEKDALLAQAERIVLDTPGIQSAFAFAGDGGLATGGPGGGRPRDAIGQIQVEMVRWEDRPKVAEPAFTLLGRTFDVSRADPAFDGDAIAASLLERLRALPGVKVDLAAQAMGPGSGKPVHLRLAGDDWDALRAAAATMADRMARMPGLVDVEDTRPLPGIDWEIDVDVEKAGRFGADVAIVGAMVQLVTRGILLDTMRVPTSDDEIEIRVRLPERDRVLSTLDTLRVRTADGLVPLANFITRRPVPQLAQIDRVDGTRFLDVKADIAPGLSAVSGPDGAALGVLRAAEAGAAGLAGPDGRAWEVLAAEDPAALAAAVADGSARIAPVTASERIAQITAELEAGRLLPDSVRWEWTGDQEEQAESGAFLAQAFIGALGLMFVILLAQFNSVYNSVLVLLAVILSTTGVLIGMLVMGQPFSIIMTGTGIVALAGIVVNNNIVLIDAYQERARMMPPLEAITRTVEDRLRPVALTTLTTMAGLAPMMFGLSFDFIAGGYSVGSPTALWWTQLATAVVWGLGVATILTLLLTPALLAARVWVGTYARAAGRLLGRIGMGRSGQAAQDWALRREARRVPSPTLLWAEEEVLDGPAATADPTALRVPLQAAE